MPSVSALPRLVASVLLVSLCSAAQAGAQVLRGTVRSHTTDAPIPDARVSILTAAEDRLEGTATTDSLGEFAIRLPEAGVYRVTAEHPAFLPASFRHVDIDGGEEVTVSLRLVDTAVPLPPLEIVGRRSSAHTILAGYFDRLERYGRGGPGRFLTRQEIAERNPPTLMRALQQGMGLRIVYRRDIGYVPYILRGTGCIPQMYLDGMSIEPSELDALMPPSEVEGVEVYASAVHPPPGFLDRTGCGVVLVWSRRDSEFTRPMTWRRWLTLGGILTLLAGATLAF